LCCLLFQENTLPCQELSSSVSWLVLLHYIIAFFRAGKDDDTIIGPHPEKGADIDGNPVFNISGKTTKINVMEELFALMIGIGLSAACGFRVFVPLLAMNLAVQTGHLEIAESSQWVATPMATTALGVASFLEIAGYYIPWVDNMLDAAATPAAIIAGTFITASVMPEMTPFLKWAIAAITGGSVAGVIQGATVLTRAASSFTTGGFGNPIVSTTEAGGSVLISLLAVLLPLVTLGLILFLLIWAGRKIYRRFQKPQAPPVHP